MNKYYDLEASILSCILQRPKLMEDLLLEDKHFKKNYKLWVFLKAFYEKFGTFDLTLMMSVAKSKYKMMEYIMYLLEQEPAPSLFKIYEKQLIELYEKKEDDKIIAKVAFELANNFYVGNITAEEFKEKIDNMFNSYGRGDINASIEGQ